MNIGKLRYQVKIQQLAGTLDAAGQENQTWQDVASLWASIEPLSGREFLTAQYIQAGIDVRIRLRYTAGITAKMRVLYGTRTFDIQAVVNTENRNLELELLCLERV